MFLHEQTKWCENSRVKMRTTKPVFDNKGTMRRVFSQKNFAGKPGDPVRFNHRPFLVTS
jgi:hypothetical protein